MLFSWESYQNQVKKKKKENKRERSIPIDSELINASLINAGLWLGCLLKDKDPVTAAD